MKIRFDELSSQGKILEAHRLKQKVTYDLNMIKELGYVKGIENYSRYFDGRSEGQAPYSLLEYYNYPFNKSIILAILSGLAI